MALAANGMASDTIVQKPYEPAYFARKHGITQAQARRITKDFGPSRVRCDTAAQNLNLALNGSPLLHRRPPTTASKK